MDNPKKPKAGSNPMTLTPQQRQMLANLPAGTVKNRFRADKPGETSPYAETPDVKTAKERLQRLIDAQKRYSNYKKHNTPSPGDVDPETGDVIGEGVKKAGHPEAFELGLDAETMDNPEYQKILRQKRVERAKQMLNPKLARTMGDDVSQDDIEAADRAARRRKRVDEAMGNEDSEYQRILQSMRANDPVLRALRGAKSAGDGMVSVKPTNLSRAEDKKLEKASRRKFNPRNVGKDAY